MSKFISSWFYAKLGTEEIKKGGFSKKVETQPCVRFADLDDFSEKLRNRYEEFDSNGYDVVNVTPILIGESDATYGKTRDFIPKKTFMGEVGFSVTRGAVVIGKKRGC